MTVEQINEWKNRRLKPGGKWVSGEDLLGCIFESMSDVGPCYGQWQRRPTVKRSYIRLVEIVCEYLRDNPRVELLRIFLKHLLISVPLRGLTFLSQDQKRRFAEQLAWMLNIPAFATTVEEFVTSLGGHRPDNQKVANDWQEARGEYKRREATIAA